MLGKLQVFMIFFACITQNGSATTPRHYNEIEHFKTDSLSLPNGISLSVSHKLDSAVTDIGTFREFTEYSYNSLNYQFSFVNNRSVYARTYLDAIDTISLVSCSDPSSKIANFANKCRDWPEFKSAVKTLIGLGYPKLEYLNGDGYEPLIAEEFDVSQDEILAWKRLMSDAASGDEK